MYSKFPTYTGEPAGTCRHCGKPLVWRMPSARSKTGKPYKVDPSDMMFHKKTCPVLSKRTPEPRPEPAPYTPTPDPQSAPMVPFTATPQYAREIEREQGDTLTATIAAAVAKYMPTPSASVDVETVREIVRAEMATGGALRIEVQAPGKAPKDMGRQHAIFPRLLRYVAARKNVLLVGPAGSGKTTLGSKVAEALDLAYYPISMGPQTPQSDFFGFMQPQFNGPATYVETVIRRAYEFGGLVLFDEFDNGDASVIKSTNQLTGNGHCCFPDGVVKRHPDFVIIAAANTYGNGASREYVGGMQLDASSLDRFATLPVDYDEALETDLTLASYRAHGGTDDSVPVAWLEFVRRARANRERFKIRHIVSPRASIDGAMMLACGESRDEVAASLLWKGLDSDSIARLAS